MNRLLQRFAFAIAATAILLVACKQTTVSPVSSPADRVKLALNQSGRLGSGIAVKVDSLYDSRCPANAVCIWQGNVILRAVLTKDSDTKAVRLVLGTDPTRPTVKRPDSTGVTLTGTTYKVVLREVTPYPGTNPAQTTEAVIEVSPQ